MATHANSIPVRRAQAIARLPHTMAPGQEFLRLMALRRQIDTRLDILVEVLGPAPALPLSGLRQPSPGVLLFKGGRHA